MTEVEARHAAPDAGVHAFDNPEAYIPSDRRRALAAGVQMPDRVEGAAVFADISGFTPLTEALATELGPQRGSEELTANLNRVQNADGSWSGHHCITGRTFCTAAALLVLTVDRAPVPVAAKIKKQ